MSFSLFPDLLRCLHNPFKPFYVSHMVSYLSFSLMPPSPPEFRPNLSSLTLSQNPSLPDRCPTS